MKRTPAALDAVILSCDCAGSIPKDHGVVRASVLGVIVCLAIALSGCWGSESRLDGRALDADADDQRVDESPELREEEPSSLVLCTTDADCDDGDPCTRDTCLPGGECLAVPLDIAEPQVIAGPVTLGYGIPWNAQRTRDHVLVSIVTVHGGSSGFLTLYRMPPDLSSIERLGVGEPSEGMPRTDLAVRGGGPGAALAWSQDHASSSRELSVMLMESWEVHTSVWYDWFGQDVHVEATPSGWFIAYHGAGLVPFEFVLADEAGVILHDPATLLSAYGDERLYNSHTVSDGEHVFAAFEQRTIRTFTELGEQTDILGIEGACGIIAGLDLYDGAFEVLLVCSETEVPSLYLRRMTRDGSLIEPDIDVTVGFTETIATGMVDFSLLPTDDATFVAFMLSDVPDAGSMLCSIPRDTAAVRCWHYDSVDTPLLAEGEGSSLVVMFYEGIGSPVQAHALCLPVGDEVGCTSHAECDDDDPCSTDRCLEGGCIHETAEDATTCGEGSICCGGTCVEGDCCSDEDCSCMGEALPCFGLSMPGCVAQLGCTYLVGCHVSDSVYPPAGCASITDAAACGDCGCVWMLDGCWEYSYGGGICETLSDAGECSMCPWHCAWRDEGACTGWAVPCATLFADDCVHQAGCEPGACADHACT